MFDGIFDGCPQADLHIQSKGRNHDQHDGCPAGSTPLHVAVRSGRQHAITMLVDAGADRDIKDGDGKLPLDLVDDCPAQNERSKEVMKEACDARTHARTHECTHVCAHLRACRT